LGKIKDTGQPKILTYSNSYSTKKGRIREERLKTESKWKIEEIKINLC